MVLYFKKQSFCSFIYLYFLFSNKIPSYVFKEERKDGLECKTMERTECHICRKQQMMNSSTATAQMEKGMTIYDKGCISNYRNSNLCYVCYSVLYLMFTNQLVIRFFNISNYILDMYIKNPPLKDEGT